MALIKTFIAKDMDRNTVHDAIEASYTVFDRDGARFVQFDSYGRPYREMPGKKSQTFQLNETSARQMFEILKSAFKL
jgi:hypothetical protein